MSLKNILFRLFLVLMVVWACGCEAVPAQQLLELDSLSGNKSDAGRHAPTWVVAPYGPTFIDFLSNGTIVDTVKVYQIFYGKDSTTEQILLLENQVTFNKDSVLLIPKDGRYHTWKILDGIPWKIHLKRQNDSGMSGKPAKFILRSLKNQYNSIMKNLFKNYADNQIEKYLQEYSYREITKEELISLIEGEKSLTEYFLKPDKISLKRLKPVTAITLRT